MSFDDVSTAPERAVETWLDSSTGPLWAAVHLPVDGTARAVAVLASSVGLEGVTLHRSMYRLGHELARRGVVAIRFAWTGDGDSGSLAPDADLPATWQANLRDVIGLGRSIAPGVPVHVIGVRLGASIDPGVEVEGWHLIEPVDGRTFVRAHAMLRKMGTPVEVMPTDAGVELNGALWTPDQAKAVRKLKPVGTSGGTPVTRVELSPKQQETFFSVAPQLAEVPLEPLIALASQIAADAVDPVPAHFSPVRSHTLEVDGCTIVEELTAIGPHQLPAVVTRPQAGDPVNAVVFAAPGAEPRSAPIGLFATLARRASAQGSVAIRADRRGLGELASVEELHAPDVYTEGAVDDVLVVADAAHAMAPGRPVIAVGPCIGAWLYLKGAPRGPFTRIIAFDSLAWDLDPDAYSWVPDTFELAYGGKKFASSLRTPPSMTEMSTRERLARVAFTRAKRTAAVVLSVLVQHCPRWVWAQLASRQIVQDPMPMLEALPDDVDVDFHFGPIAAAAFERTRGVQSAVAARNAGKRITLTRWESFDHSIFAHRARETAANIVLNAAARDR